MKLPLFVFASSLVFAGCSDGSPAGFAFQKNSPWPKFRGNAVQDGSSSIHASSTSGAFWSFRTGKGVFSSPVVGADGTIYVGSADQTFYALNPDGSLKWKLLTGEIIDSAALLDDQGRVYFGSGDGNLRALDAQTGAVEWMTPADSPTVNSALINWFEGNVALSPSGNLYAGNDNYFVYQFDRKTGAIVDRLKVPDQTWSLPAFDEKGNFFVGNNNVVSFLGSNLFAFDAHDNGEWDSFSGVGSVAASPMLTSDGAFIVGGFDGFVRAYDQKSGNVRWEFGARDHLYASPARLPDGTVLQAAADGSLYALDPATGALKWAFDGTDPIRSSPSVDADGHIYFGAGDGRLWVLNPDGSVRWSVLLIDADRNDVNASPALGRDAVYIAGESGEVFSVPYDYCLREPGMSDARCAPPTLPSLPDDGALLLFTTPFGSQVATPPTTIDPNQPLVFSLVVRQSGHDALGILDGSTVKVSFDPPAQVTTTVSGDGKFITLEPTQPLVAAADGTVGVSISAGTLVNLDRAGLKLSGGSPGPMASLNVRMKLSPTQPTPYQPMIPGTTWEVSRLALPLPTLLPSYNQIGFDSLHYLVGLVEGTNGHAIAWMAGAMLASDGKSTVIDPTTRALFPLEVDAAGGFFTFSTNAGVSVEVTSAVIPLSSFRMAAALGPDGNATGPLRVTGSAKCSLIATYGLFLEKLGLCNPQTDVLSVTGAANFTLFSAATPPTGVGTVGFSATADAVTATLTGSTLHLADHAVAVLLVDANQGTPVTLDYGLDTVRTADASGNLQTVSIPITGKMVPSSVRAYLMVDTTPAAMGTVTIP